ncbi:MAG TPA: hypothetical protein VGN86_09390 [Pyrinomonadaceae bacterium]|nr:hypothetical protein [Pyrinomonadaceae bacterium]
MSLLESNNLNRNTNQSRSVAVLGILAAVVFTALVFTGYSLLRGRHQRKVIESQISQVPRSNEPTGPPKVQILVDEALLKGDQTLLGGTVKNISDDMLNDLSVNLELIRRKDNGTEKITAPVEPAQLGPKQDGRYSLQLHAADYLSVRLVGLTSGKSSDLMAYVAGPGQKRPPEKVPPGKIIIVSRPSSSKGGFLNTPDTPGKVP